jgi:hypothetical protein
MSEADKVKKYILKNPSLSNDEAAKGYGTTINYVRKCKTELRKEGKLPALDPNWRRKHPALEKQCEEIGLPSANVSNYWYKGKHFSIHVKGEKSFFDVADDIVSQMKGHAPKYPKLNYPKIKDGHLLVIDPADIHIGKLCSEFETGEEYNSKIATERVKEGIEGILSKSKGFNIDQILLIIGNDALHVDTPRSTTTSGTPQDTELMWYDAFKIALNLYRESIERLLQIAPVFVQYDPSNHD